MFINLPDENKDNQSDQCRDTYFYKLCTVSVLRKGNLHLIEDFQGCVRLPPFVT